MDRSLWESWRMFPPVSEVVPPGKIGDVSITSMYPTFVQQLMALNAGLPAPVSYAPYSALAIGGEVFMSDTPLEHWTNRELVERAAGHVLIAGLGLGMLLPVLFEKRDVASITVVEKSTEVIKLVAPWYYELAPVRFGVIHADAWEFFAASRQDSYDTIYLDIWPNMESVTEESDALEGLARPSLREGGWLGVWIRDELLAAKHSMSVEACNDAFERGAALFGPVWDELLEACGDAWSVVRQTRMLIPHLEKWRRDLEESEGERP